MHDHTLRRPQLRPHRGLRLCPTTTTAALDLGPGSADEVGFLLSLGLLSLLLLELKPSGAAARRARCDRRRVRPRLPQSLETY